MVCRPVFSDLAQGTIGAWRIRPFYAAQQAGVVQFAEEVAGVETAFAVGFFGGLGELPVVEAGA